MKQAYQQSIEQILEQLNSNSTTGLSKQQSKEFLKIYGPNAFAQKPQPSWIRVFLAQFASPLIYILLIAAILIFLISDDPFDAFIISGILLFNALVGTIQEGRTQKILRSLTRFINQECVVVRNGEKIVIASATLVPGDIIIVNEGQRVPADARIIEAHNLRIDESMLTGEATPVLKTDAVISADVSLADQKNMLYSGTYVMGGWAKAVVIATGLHTEIGKIHQSVQEIHTDVPLAKEMYRLSWLIIYCIIGMCLFLFSIGLLAHQPIKELFVVLTALFICVIPEGLPIVLTLVLVNGVYRMAKKQVLIKNMQAVEGLGHANVIVIDKTGTLTRNEMIVSHVFADDKHYTVSGKGYYPEGLLFADGQNITPDPKSDLYCMAQGLNLLNTATITFVSERGTFDIKGDPTEAALFVFSQKMGINSEAAEQKFQKIYEIPFEAKHKYHAAFYTHDKGKKGIAFVVGSPEFIFQHAKVSSDAYVALQDFLGQGLRVIAVALRKFDPRSLVNADVSEQEYNAQFKHLVFSDLQLLGLCGIEDALRAEAPYTIANARKAGLHIIMATGDHQRTALAIAKAVGIYRDGDEAIDGPELSKISDEQLRELIIHTTVFSRVTPDQKLRIIQALHANELTVAMTGDGINDAPSLVAADIGIGMGGIGTEVAKEAADIILLDDSVANIIHAIEEGRYIIYTLRRVIVYFFSTNFAEMLVILFSFIISLLYPSMHFIFPLTAAQILWLNLITDGFLDSALAMEKKEKGLLFEQKWLAKKHIQLVDAQILIRMFFIAIPMALGSLWMFILYSSIDLRLARTMTLVTLGMFQWFNAWNCRSDTKSIFQLGLCSNRWLILATAVVLVLQLFLLYTPFLQKIFDTEPLTIYQWLFIICMSSTIILLDEIRKWMVRRRES